MIEINMVPMQLRKKKRQKSSSQTKSFALPSEAVVGMVGGFFVLLVLAHVGLQFLISMKYVEHKDLVAETKTLSVGKKNSDAVLRELRSFQGKVKDVKAITEEEKIYWAPKLNEIANQMPPVVWLTKIAFLGDVFVLEGSSASDNNSEILEINEFTSNLKKSSSFSEGFGEVEMGVHKTRKVNRTSIADFTIEANLKSGAE